VTGSTAPKVALAAMPARPARVVQRKCGCGAHTASATGDCPQCQRRKRLQPKLAIGASHDPLEHEADRIADQVMAGRGHNPANDSPLRIQRFSGQAIGDPATAPDSVDRVLATPGVPLEPVVRHNMEARFGYDFSRVRVHSDTASARSARHVHAHAYTAGYDIVFDTGRFAPATTEGRRLLAHELTHVVQQAGVSAAIQRDASGSSEAPDAGELVKAHYWEMKAEQFGPIADKLLKAYARHASPYSYIIDVFEKFQSSVSDWEDNIAAAFVDRLLNRDLNKFAADREGRYALTLLYQAIITGSVTEYERKQANRILLAKTKQIDPEKFVKMATSRGDRLRTPIFPIRFMRVTGGDYAPPDVKLLSNGRLLVKYPSNMQSMSTFKEERQTLGNVFGAGMELSVNEIVGIKDYERGGGIQYLPAMVLIDYANQAIESTSGKIIEVSITVATLGIGGGVGAGRAAAKELITSTAIWGARLGKAARVLDRAATVIEIAAFVINENRDWIISQLGEPGRRLVQLSNAASSAIAVYGLARLGQAGYHIVKEMRKASKEARALKKQLDADQSQVLKRIDDETDLMLKQLDDDAAKSAAPTAVADKPGATVRVDEPVAPKTPKKGGKPTGAVDELEVAASKIGISKSKLKGEVEDLRGQGEVEDLRGQTVDPDSVRQPKSARLDAEMDAQGHNFKRNKRNRTWCRHSPDETCDLDLGNGLNKDVDDVIAKKQTKFEKIEQERKAREAAPPRERPQKREKAETAETDPKTAKAKDRAKQQVARENTRKALQSQVDRAKDLELQLRIELDAIEQRAKQRLDRAERASLDAEKLERSNQINKQIEKRSALQKQLDDLAITPYDRARAYSYSTAAAEEVIGRSRRTVDVPGQPKKVAIVDEMSGKPVKNPSIDHVVPVDEIVLMDGWDKLRPHQQQQLLSRADNLRMMEKSANSSKGSKRWAKWPQGRRIYGEKVWRQMVEEEARLRKAIQDRITEILAGAPKAA
jgi:hypothetical protein